MSIDNINDEVVENTIKIIYERLTYGKFPVEHPIAIIVSGQPGAGKTGLIAKTSSQLPNSVVLDIDDFRYFYPNVIDVMKNHPDELVSQTTKFVGEVTKKLTKLLIDGKYNLVLHKTLKDEVIISDTIKPLIEKGYEIVIRAMIVCEIESKLSALERTLSFKKMVGWCRWVTKENHDYAYNNMPKVINEIFVQKLCKCVQVFKRCNIPTNAILMYSVVQKGADCSYTNENNDLQVCNFNSSAFTSILDAVEQVRNIDRIEALKDVNKRLNCVKKKIKNPENLFFVNEIKDLYKTYYKKYYFVNGRYINNNTRLELAKEIMARMIALNCCENFSRSNEKLLLLLEEEKQLNKFNPQVVNKIIFEYGPIVKIGEDYE